MTETPEPTPTSDDAAMGDARDAAAAWFGEVEGHAEVTEEDRRQADDLFDWMGHFGYRIVRTTPDAGRTVTVPLDDLRAALDAMVYVQDTYFWEKWNYQEPFDRLTAIAASGGQT